VDEVELYTSFDERVKSGDDTLELILLLPLGFNEKNGCYRALVAMLIESSFSYTILVIRGGRVRGQLCSRTMYLSGRVVLTRAFSNSETGLFRLRELVEVFHSDKPCREDCKDCSPTVFMCSERSAV